MGLAVAVGAMSVPAGASSTNLLVNGGFESGSFSPGWNTMTDGGGQGFWSVTTGNYAACGGTKMAPIEGTHEALWNMDFPSWGILTSNPFTVPADGQISLDYAYQNFAGTWQQTPGTYDIGLNYSNEWIRIDVIAATADPQTLSSNDIVATLFNSQVLPHPAYSQGWTAASASLSAFAGRQVVLRVVTVNDLNCLPVWVDNVALTVGNSPATPVGVSVSSQGGYLHAQWLPSANATSYTCTLLYGFNSPSGFSVTTSTPSCWFAGAGGSTSYGVSVVANNDTGSSPAAVSFYSPPAPTRLVCQRAGHRRVVRAVNPSCPVGWKPVGGARTGGY